MRSDVVNPPAGPDSRYRIRVRGHLDPVWSTWFDGLTVDRSADGTTELVGPLADEAALFGLLAGLRGLGATLLLVERLDAQAEDAGPRERPAGRRRGAVRRRAS